MAWTVVVLTCKLVTCNSTLIYSWSTFTWPKVLLNMLIGPLRSNPANVRRLLHHSPHCIYIYMPMYCHLPVLVSPTWCKNIGCKVCLTHSPAHTIFYLFCRVMMFLKKSLPMQVRYSNEAYPPIIVCTYNLFLPFRDGDMEENYVRRWGLMLQSVLHNTKGKVVVLII